MLTDMATLYKQYKWKIDIMIQNRNSLYLEYWRQYYLEKQILYINPRKQLYFCIYPNREDVENEHNKIFYMKMESRERAKHTPQSKL